MTNTAQTAFKTFQDNQLKSNYNWDAMTAEQKQAEMDEYTRLKIAAAKEAEANRIESEQQQSTMNDMTAEQKHSNKIIIIRKLGTWQ